MKVRKDGQIAEQHSYKTLTWTKASKIIFSYKIPLIKKTSKAHKILVSMMNLSYQAESEAMLSLWKAKPQLKLVLMTKM